MSGLKIHDTELLPSMDWSEQRQALTDYRTKSLCAGGLTESGLTAATDAKQLDNGMDRFTVGPSALFMLRRTGRELVRAEAGEISSGKLEAGKRQRSTNDRLCIFDFAYNASDRFGSDELLQAAR